MKQIQGMRGFPPASPPLGPGLAYGSGARREFRPHRLGRVVVAEERAEPPPLDDGRAVCILARAAVRRLLRRGETQRFAAEQAGRAAPERGRPLTTAPAARAPPTFAAVWFFRSGRDLAPCGAGSAGVVPPPPGMGFRALSSGASSIRIGCEGLCPLQHTFPVSSVVLRWNAERRTNVDRKLTVAQGL